MSKVMRRKHVQKETMDDLSLPSESQAIVRVTKVQGNNLVVVQEPDESIYLASMPTKFRKNIWVVRGGYVLVEPISEGNKVKAEIVKVLQREDIKYYKEENVWPEAFQDKKVDQKAVNNSSGSDEDDELFVNTNRLVISVSEEDSSDSESTDSDSEEGDSDFEDAEDILEEPTEQNENDAK